MEGVGRVEDSVTVAVGSLACLEELEGAGLDLLLLLLIVLLIIAGRRRGRRRRRRSDTMMHPANLNDVEMLPRGTFVEEDGAEDLAA